ncbi:MAG TPA: hypothetical protein VHG88_00265 [Burkholderiales bacterium]|nr:hypothetical protein [Burkholderiales bacterium]
MNPKISRLLALIPERSLRLATGTRFVPAVAVCAQPERLAAVAQFLSWMTPLGALTREEQQRLGIASSGPRPADAADEADDTEAEVEEPVA